MIEGITHTPTQQDSHEELQQRQGWSVAAMREEIDKLTAENAALKMSAVRQREAVLTAKIDALTRQLNGHQAHVRNALTLLRAVNCGNLDQAKVRQAILELEDIDKRRSANAP